MILSPLYGSDSFLPAIVCIERLLIVTRSVTKSEFKSIPIFDAKILRVARDPIEEYFATIQAPKKELLLLENADHTAVLTMPEVFLKELVARVRPVVNDPEANAQVAQR